MISSVLSLSNIYLSWGAVPHTVCILFWSLIKIFFIFYFLFDHSMNAGTTKGGSKNEGKAGSKKKCLLIRVQYKMEVGFNPDI